jgi:hypothetical protein
MKGLASFAMTGRYRALVLAIASSGSLLFAWVGAAVVALVTLRKGGKDGFWLLLWASLPALVITRITGDSSVLVLLLGTALLAQALRASASLVLAALLSSVVAVLTGLGLLAFGQVLLTELSELFVQFFAALERQTLEAGGESLGLTPPTLGQLAGMMGTANGLLSFLCLALARYWQAALYNPGGFGSEFRDLRLPPPIVWGLALMALATASLGLAYRSWGAAMLLPLTVAGFALLHARAHYRGQGSFWISGVYIAWVVFDAAKLGLVALVLADALMNFRGRWQADPQDEALQDDRETQEEDDAPRADGDDRNDVNDECDNGRDGRRDDSHDDSHDDSGKNKDD